MIFVLTEKSKTSVVDDPIASSRWERVDDVDGEEMKPVDKAKSKWEKVEGVKMGKSIKEDEEEDSPNEKEQDGKRKDSRGRDKRFSCFSKFNFFL